MNNEKKVSIDLITDWKAGEVITEEKIKAVFGLIGNVINAIDDKTLTLQQQVNNLQIATRWIGQVETFSQIQDLINSLKNQQEFQPPNLPLPSSGDTILVKNNKDDERYPNLDKGSYIYVYLVNSVNNQGNWEIYVPFGVPVASEINDGIMSRNDYVKLKELPTKRELNTKLTELTDITTNHTTLINNNTTQLNKHTNKLILLENKTNELDNTKQPKITSIDGMKSKSVEGNITELNSRLKVIEDSNSLIWPLNVNDETINRPGTLTFQPTENNKFWTYGFRLPAESGKRILPGCNIKITFKYEDGTGSDGVYHIVEVIYKDTDQTGINTEFTKIGGGYIYLENRIPVYVKIWKETDDIYTIKLISNENMRAGNVLSLENIVKDMGHSDYILSDYILNKLDKWFQDNKTMETFTIYQNIKDDNFNGFKIGDVFNLGFDYIYGSGSLFISCGGILLTQHQDYEEIRATDENPLGNKIRFLKEFDLNQNGGMTFKIITTGLNSYRFVPWNAKTWFLMGDAVYRNAKVFIAKKDNIGKDPVAFPDYWSDFELKVNLTNFQTEIDNMIKGLTTKNMDQYLATKPAGDIRVKVQSTYETYLNETSFKNEINKLSNVTCYFNLGNSKQSISWDNKDSYMLVINNEVDNYKVKWLYDIFQPCLASNLIIDGTNLSGRTINIKQLMYSKYSSLFFTSEQELNAFLTELNNKGATLPINLKTVNFENDFYKIKNKLNYYQGQIILFSTKEEIDKFIEKNNFVENADFAFLADDKYLLNSNDYEIDNRIGGSNFIKRSDLPNINLVSFNYVWDEGVYKTWWGSQFGHSPLAQRRIELYLNGNVSQTEFKPSFQKVCGIKILKNIFSEIILTWKQDITINTNALIN